MLYIKYYIFLLMILFSSCYSMDDKEFFYKKPMESFIKITNKLSKSLFLSELDIPEKCIINSSHKNGETISDNSDFCFSITIPENTKMKKFYNIFKLVTQEKQWIVGRMVCNSNYISINPDSDNSIDLIGYFPDISVWHGKAQEDSD